MTGYTSNYFGTSTEYQSEADAKRFNVDDFAAAFVRLEGGIILDFRIAWAMHLDTPGDSIIMGTKGSLRIPSTDCWNGTVGGPMTIYHDVAGAQTQTTIPVIESKGPGLFDRKIRSFLDAVKNARPRPFPPARSCTTRPSSTTSSSPRSWATRSRSRSRRSKPHIAKKECRSPWLLHSFRF